MLFANCRCDNMVYGVLEESPSTKKRGGTYIYGRNAKFPYANLL